jgi:DNA-binding CsgD family transcriptional regulator
MKKCELYLITRSDGEKYVGITTQGLSRRIWQHKNGYGSSHLKGQEFQTTKILEGPEDKVSILEDYFINAFNCSLNKIIGGKFGRGLKGSENGMSILKESDIPEIVCLYTEKGLTQQQIADMYSVSRGSISPILSGKTWNNVSRDSVKSKRNLVSQDNRKEILELWESGISNIDISYQLGIKYHTVYLYTKNLPVVSNKQKNTRKISEGTIDRIYELHKEGLKPQKIADHLKIGRTTVNRYLAKKELK